jgi:hypothetical protein
VVTHDHAVAARMPRRIQMLDGRVTSDTVTPVTPPPVPAGATPAVPPSQQEQP